MKRIIVFSAYYEPEVAASLYLASNLYEHLAEKGFKIDLYTPTPTRGVDENTRKYYKYNRTETNGNLTIHRVPLMKESKGTISRAFRYLLMNLKYIYIGLTHKSDLIYVQSTPPTMGAMAAIIKKFKRIPFVYNLQDIFPDSLVSTGIAKKGSMAWKIGRIIENFTYRNADKIIVISEDFKNNLLAKGVPEEKIEVIYNWVDENAVVNIDRENNILFEKYQLPKDKFYVTYCGNIGLTQNMDMLLEVAEELSSNKNLHFVLVGDGAYRDKVEELIEDGKIDNVTILPFQPYEEISHVFSLGNVGLIISKPGVGANSVPSKTWSIMSASRPVIASFDENELKDIIDDNKCGIFTKAGDKEALKNAILELYNDPKRCEEYGKNGRRFIMENLTVEKGTEAYINSVFNLCRN